MGICWNVLEIPFNVCYTVVKAPIYPLFLVLLRVLHPTSPVLFIIVDLFRWHEVPYNSMKNSNLKILLLTIVFYVLLCIYVSINKMGKKTRKQGSKGLKALIIDIAIWLTISTLLGLHYLYKG